MSASITMSDRQRLIELLRGLWHAEEAAGGPQILDIVYRQLHQELRPRLLVEFGSQVGKQSASTRFTELLNRFFAKVMGAFPDGMERVRNRRALSGYVAQALRRMIYEHSRNKNKRESSCDDTLLDCLIDDRRSAFRHDCPDVQYESLHAALDRWERSRDPLRRQWARLINYRYFLGETIDRTARDLGISNETFYCLHQQALEQLRREVP
jgi:DNA-directed RNA polymerase specialized sigma24 family protein